MAQIFTELDPSGTSGAVMWVQTAENNAAFRSQFSGAAPPTTPAPIAGQRHYPTGAGGIVQEFDGAAWQGTQLKSIRADDNEALTRIGSISATTDRYIYVVKRNVTIVSVKMVSDTTTVSTGADRWTLNVRNLTAAADLRSAAFDSNGDDFAADTVKDLGVNQNLDVNAGAVLELQVTKNGSATTMNEVAVLVDANPR